MQRKNLVFGDLASFWRKNYRKRGSRVALWVTKFEHSKMASKMEKMVCIGFQKSNFSSDRSVLAGVT